MVKISKSLIALFVVCAFIAGIVSCSKSPESTYDKDVKAAKEAKEKAGEKVAEKAEEAGQKAKDAGQKVKEAGQKVKEAAKPAKK